MNFAVSATEERTRDFDAFFKAHYGRLARLLCRVTGDMARAEEVTAEAFFRLHGRPPRSSTNREGWLYRTGCRLALDLLKKERRRARYEALASALRFAGSPERELAKDDERARVRRVLSAIKPNQASLILLRSDGFTYAEIATAMNLNPASVGTQLSRAEEAFRKEYVSRYGNP